MITIGASSETGAAAGAGQPAEEKHSASGGGRKRVPLMAIPITLSVGLLVAAGYVGHRIFVARIHATPAVHSAAPAAGVPPMASQNARNAEPETVPTPAQPPSEPAAVPGQTLAALSKAESKPAEPASQAVPPVPASPSKPESKPAEGSSAANHLAAGALASGELPAADLLVPQPGERYLQVLAASTRFAPRILADLRRKNLDVRLAPGPQEDLRRFLVGPFPDEESLRRAKEEIQKLHPDAFVRAY
ncbi:MAG TPA: hypothetical protein VEV17_13605 [Bryobacteraceae bacterium]|nr:hypothetical protein [Bryobacteraceae bacterium]